MDLNRLGRGQLGHAFARIFGVDDLAAVATLAPEIMPVCSLSERVEFWALTGGKLGYSGGLVGAGGAGTNVTFQLTNPLNSGALLIIEAANMGSGYFEASVEAIGNVTVLPTTLGGRHRDTRLTTGATATLGLAGVVTVGAIVTLAHTPALRLPNGHQPVEFVVGPGFVFQGRAVDPNLAMHFGLAWRERPVTDKELNLR